MILFDVLTIRLALKDTEKALHRVVYSGNISIIIINNLYYRSLNIQDISLISIELLTVQLTLKCIEKVIHRVVYTEDITIIINILLIICIIDV